MMDPDSLEGLNRKQLQALCKTHGIPANLKSTDMVLRLSLRFQERQKPLKKVKFSPENDQTFLFVDSDSDSDHFTTTTRFSRRLARSRPHTTETALGRATRSKKNNAATVEGPVSAPPPRTRKPSSKSKESVAAQATVEEECGKPRKRHFSRAAVVPEPVSGKRRRTRRAKTPTIQEDHRSVVESKQENSLLAAEEMVPEPDSPAGVEVNALKTNEDSSDATEEVTHESVDDHNDGAEEDKPLCGDVTENMVGETAEEEAQENENMVVGEAEENDMDKNVDGHHLSYSSTTTGCDYSEDPNYGECSEELKAESVIVKSLDAEIADCDGKPDTQEEACSVELALDAIGKSEPEKSTEEADDNGVGPAVFQESGKQIAEEMITPEVSNETSPQNQVNEAELTSESDSVSKDGVPKSAHHFGLEGNEPETPIASNKSGSWECEGRSEVSHADGLIEITSLSADDDPVLENEIGKMGYGLNTKDYSETHEGPVVPQGDVDSSPQSQEEKVGVTSEKMFLDDLLEEDSISEGGGPGLADHFTLEKFLEGNESETPSASNKTRSLDRGVRNEAPQTGEVLERSISFIADDLALLEDRADAEKYSETKNDDVKGGIAAQQAEADSIIESEKIVPSSLGDDYGSPFFNEEINDGSKNAVSAVDEGASLQGNKSRPEKVNLNSCVSSEDSLDPTTGPREEHDVSTPMFLEELFRDHEDGKQVELDTVQEDGSLNMDVDCFIPSLDTGVPEIGVQSAEVTTLEFNASLRNGEEADMKKLHDLFAEEDAEENVIMNEESDQAFGRQFSEHEHHTEQDVSHDLVLGSGVDSSEQVSAIIQEYMERETRDDDFITMNSYAVPNEGRVANDFEDAVPNSISMSSVDNPKNDCGEDEMFNRLSNDRAEMEEDNGIMFKEPVLQKLTDTVNHELPGMPKQEGAGYKSFEFETLIEAIKHTDISLGDPAKYSGNCESGRVKDMGMFGVSKDLEGTIKVNQNLCDSAGDITTNNDEPCSEKGGSSEKAELFVIAQEMPENSDTCGATELKMITSTANVEIIDVAFGNKEMEEKCNTPIAIQENRDGAIEFHRPVDIAEIDAASEDANTMQVKSELVEESARQTNPTKRTNTNIPATPTNLHKVHHDMKENAPSTKMEHFGSVTASRKSAIRRPLQDVQKH